jgi:porin
MKDRLNKRSGIVAALIFLIGISFSLSAGAQETAPANPYSGDFWSRSTLTGDWGGVRNDLAANGVTFDMSLTQVYQGVVDGGEEELWKFCGRGSLTIKVDTGKLGLWPGGFLTAEVEGNFGKGVNGKVGSLMPVNTNQLFPTPNKNEFDMPALNFTQFLSEYCGVIVGKLDTTSGDMNEFAHGKGDTQFTNLALNLNPALLVTVPYSTLGAGVVILPNKDPKAAIITLLVLSSEGKASTSGFDNLNNDKLTYNAEGRVRTNFFGMTGHQLVGSLYSNKEFTSIDQRLSLDPSIQGIAKKSGSWAGYYNFDQYLYEPVKGSGKGFGIFGRFSAADGNPNFMQYLYSFGVSGKGLMSVRPDDSYGIGWYYININNPALTTPIGTRKFLRDEQGVEAYYSIALTPWAHLTPNIQVIHGAQKRTLAALLANGPEIGTGTIMGVRLQVVF